MTTNVNPMTVEIEKLAREAGPALVNGWHSEPLTHLLYTNFEYPGGDGVVMYLGRGQLTDNGTTMSQLRNHPPVLGDSELKKIIRFICANYDCALEKDALFVPLEGGSVPNVVMRLGQVCVMVAAMGFVGART